MLNPAGAHGSHSPERTEQGRVEVSRDELRERAAERWTRLSEHDLDALASEVDAFTSGNFDLLIGRLRERYSLPQHAAEEAVALFVRELAAPPGGPGPQHSPPSVGLGRDKSAR